VPHDWTGDRSTKNGSGILRLASRGICGNLQDEPLLAIVAFVSLQQGWEAASDAD